VLNPRIRGVASKQARHARWFRWFTAPQTAILTALIESNVLESPCWRFDLVVGLNQKAMAVRRDWYQMWTLFVCFYIVGLLEDMDHWLRVGLAYLCWHYLLVLYLVCLSQTADNVDRIELYKSKRLKLIWLYRQFAFVFRDVSMCCYTRSRRVQYLWLSWRSSEQWK